MGSGMVVAMVAAVVKIMEKVRVQVNSGEDI